MQDPGYITIIETLNHPELQQALKKIWDSWKIYEDKTIKEVTVTGLFRKKDVTVRTIRNPVPMREPKITLPVIEPYVNYIHLINVDEHDRQYLIKSALYKGGSLYLFGKEEQVSYQSVYGENSSYTEVTSSRILARIEDLELQIFKGGQTTKSGVDKFQRITLPYYRSIDELLDELALRFKIQEEPTFKDFTA